VEKLLNRKFVTIIILLGLCGCGVTKGKTTLVNESNSVIKMATIQVSGESFSFENIAPSESREFSFVVGGESGYDVKIVFNDNRELQKELGYVSSGINTHDVIHVKETDIASETVSQEVRKF
jgi:hypothetical protein